MTDNTETIDVFGAQLEIEWLGACLDEDSRVLVYLHEGLGCVKLWRNFPHALSERLGLPSFMYSRQGYGKSDPVTLPRTARFMHDEGLEVLPKVLDTAEIDRAILIGHSDGASITLINAGGVQDPRVEAVVLLAAHVFNEYTTIQGAEAAKLAFETSDLRGRLARYHGTKVDRAFWGWNNIWLNPEFKAWNIEKVLPEIVPMETIPYVNIAVQWSREKDELLPIVERVLASGKYVGGVEVDMLEAELGNLFNVEHVVAVNSGTDALMFGLNAVGVGPGDEVITPPNSFIASTAAIAHLGAKPVFVDVCAEQNIDPNLIEGSITKHTKAIMPVHLTGRMANMKAITEVSNKFNIPIVEDAAQAVGSRYENQPSGTWGIVGCFSTHPLKNLNSCGDGGFITTNDGNIADSIRSLRNHGLVGRDTVSKFGLVSRMDEIQAAILRYRLNRLADVVSCRRFNASLYRSVLNSEVIFHPADAPLEFNTWHTFVIQVDCRNQLQEFLRSNNIETSVHYPVPIHLQPASIEFGYATGDFPVTEKQAERILTLPIHQNLKEEEIHRVATAINEYFGY